MVDGRGVHLGHPFAVRLGFPFAPPGARRQNLSIHSVRKSVLSERNAISRYCRKKWTQYVIDFAEYIDIYTLHSADGSHPWNV